MATISNSEILLRIPNIPQEGYNCSSYIVKEYIEHLPDFIYAIFTGKGCLNYIDLKLIDKAMVKYLKVVEALGLDRSLDPFTEARKNILDPSFGEKWSQLWIGQSQTWIGYPGGNSAQDKAEIMAYLEEHLHPGRVFVITRSEHSFFFIVVSSGSVMICDSLLKDRLIVTKKGLKQHIFQLKNDVNDYFDLSDVEIGWYQPKIIPNLFTQKNGISCLFEIWQNDIDSIVDSFEVFDVKRKITCNDPLAELLGVYPMRSFVD